MTPAALYVTERSAKTKSSETMKLQPKLMHPPPKKWVSIFAQSEDLTAAVGHPGTGSKVR